MVTKHLTLLLLIGFAFWSCEEENTTIIDSWEYVDYEVITAQVSDSLDLSYIDSITADGHQYRRELQLIFTFTEDSMSWSGDKFSYYISNDTIYTPLVKWHFQLLDDILKIGGGQTRTDSTGAFLYEYDEWWIFDRM